MAKRPTLRFPALLSLPLALLAFTCSSLKVAVFGPADGALVDDATLRASGAFGLVFDVSTAEVRIDGVDLIGALGLSPPFAGAGGVVTVGAQMLSVSNFSFDRGAVAGVPFGPWLVRLDVAGLSEGSHQIELHGVDTEDAEPRTAVAGFEVVSPFTLEADAIAASGAREPESAGAEGTLHAATFGQPLAAPPVALSGGGELRSGFVEVSEARIAGATP